MKVTPGFLVKAAEWVMMAVTEEQEEEEGVELGSSSPGLLGLQQLTCQPRSYARTFEPQRPQGWVSIWDSHQPAVGTSSQETMG